MGACEEAARASGGDSGGEEAARMRGEESRWARGGGRAAAVARVGGLG